MKRVLAAPAVYLLLSGCTGMASGQSLGNAGTIEGTVVDPSGAAVGKAAVELHNPLTGYSQGATSAADGSFRLVNLPPNSYHLEITAPGFEPFAQDVTVRGSVPIQVKAALVLSGNKSSVTVEASGADMLETDPSAHVDTDQQMLAKLPTVDPGAGLSDAITYSTGGVAADANGMFHPLGDHAQVSFNIDGQEISDQQSKVFSTQLPVGAVQGMQIVTGTPEAQFGDKTSLVANITTRSGLGANGLTGSVYSDYGSFGTGGGGFGLGWGNAKYGNFIAMDGTRSGRFLDSPEFQPYHDIGNNESLFDRLDFQPTQNDVLHLDLYLARNWIQIPNDLDQLGQDQRQRVLTWNAAPGYQHTFGPHVLLTINPYIRKDEFFYYGSRDPFQDTPATESQARQLLNWGTKADVSILTGHHDIKFGIDLKQTRLLENFTFGVTDPAFNPICVNGTGAAAGPLSVVNPAACAGLGLSVNPNLSPGLIPFDLTRGGSPFFFHSTGNISQAAGYIQDTITLGHFVITPGFRFDYYDGLVTATGPQPRLGLAYNIKGTGTVLRVAYARTFETPFNENLLLSSATGVGGLDQNVFGSNSTPIRPGNRNQFNTGFEQSIGKYLLLDADYFWKYTHGAFDFSTLLNTTITFPISWHNSKLDGVTGRLSTVDLKGFQAYWTFGHTRARYFFPEVGGLVAQGTPLSGSVFRIDHDQAFQSTANFRYQRKKAEWISLVWRFDSGLVVSGIPDAGAALGLTPNQQVTLGLACNGAYATLAAPLTTCLLPGGGMGLVTSKLLTLPQGGYAGFPSQENDDHNPDRVQPRNVFDLGIGSDNLLHTERRQKLTASLEIANLTNKVALYNFLSTFSGTHFLQPRTVMARIAVVF